MQTIEEEARSLIDCAASITPQQLSYPNGAICYMSKVKGFPLRSKEAIIAYVRLLEDNPRIMNMYCAAEMATDGSYDSGFKQVVLKIVTACTHHTVLPYEMGLTNDPSDMFLNLRWDYLSDYCRTRGSRRKCLNYFRMDEVEAIILEINKLLNPIVEPIFVEEPVEEEEIKVEEEARVVPEPIIIECENSAHVYQSIISEDQFEEVLLTMDEVSDITFGVSGLAPFYVTRAMAKGQDFLDVLSLYSEEDATRFRSYYLRGKRIMDQYFNTFLSYLGVKMSWADVSPMIASTIFSRCGGGWFHENAPPDILYYLCGMVASLVPESCYISWFERFLCHVFKHEPPEIRFAEYIRFQYVKSDIKCPPPSRLAALMLSPGVDVSTWPPDGVSLCLDIINSRYDVRSVIVNAMRDRLDYIFLPYFGAKIQWHRDPYFVLAPKGAGKTYYTRNAQIGIDPNVKRVAIEDTELMNFLSPHDDYVTRTELARWREEIRGTYVKLLVAMHLCGALILGSVTNYFYYKEAFDPIPMKRLVVVPDATFLQVLLVRGTDYSKVQRDYALCEALVEQGIPFERSLFAAVGRSLDVT